MNLLFGHNAKCRKPFSVKSNAWHDGLVFRSSSPQCRYKLDTVRVRIAQLISFAPKFALKDAVSLALTPGNPSVRNALNHDCKVIGKQGCSVAKRWPVLRVWEGLRKYAERINYSSEKIL